MIKIKKMLSFILLTNICYMEKIQPSVTIHIPYNLTLTGISLDNNPAESENGNPSTVTAYYNAINSLKPGDAPFVALTWQSLLWAIWYYSPNNDNIRCPVDQPAQYIYGLNYTLSDGSNHNISFGGALCGNLKQGGSGCAPWPTINIVKELISWTATSILMNDVPLESLTLGTNTVTLNGINTIKQFLTQNMPVTIEVILIGNQNYLMKIKGQNGYISNITAPPTTPQFVSVNGIETNISFNGTPLSFTINPAVTSTSSSISLSSSQLTSLEIQCGADFTSSLTAQQIAAINTSIYTNNVPVIFRAQITRMGQIKQCSIFGYSGTTQITRTDISYDLWVTNPSINFFVNTTKTNAVLTYSQPVTLTP